ncbi:hypothetical protein N7532_010374 [Penicillium argentinense]|uniref:Uncharacterized protein n=1 Tax=Penicillium argentinense TaxID=1131581 RepID=A0A9W9JXW1_9EURO|nr:uncharacterized protein N7532_010374 [Penicillium argentinense]KAJ5085603.1 hypothetical protein N7532_010374 [Penicillium argentinense]
MSQSEFTFLAQVVKPINVLVVDSTGCGWATQERGAVGVFVKLPMTSCTRSRPDVAASGAGEITQDGWFSKNWEGCSFDHPPAHVHAIPPYIILYHSGQQACRVHSWGIELKGLGPRPVKALLVDFRCMDLAMAPNEEATILCG